MADELAAAPARTIVTIDGPAGAGKSTTAREAARRLGYRYLDSGALYRTLTHALLHEGVAEERWPGLDRAALDRLGVTVSPGARTLEVAFRGRPLGDELRSPRVTARVSTVASLPAVREWLAAHQRAVGKEGRLVTDGRDMGTVIFPDAGTKVFLHADLEERARRRLGERGVHDPEPDELRREAERLDARDRADRTRNEAPLRPAPDAVEIDTTALTFDEQVEVVVRLARRLDPEAGPRPTS